MVATLVFSVFNTEVFIMRISFLFTSEHAANAKKFRHRSTVRVYAHPCMCVCVHVHVCVGVRERERERERGREGERGGRA